MISSQTRNTLIAAVAVSALLAGGAGLLIPALARPRTVDDPWRVSDVSATMAPRRTATRT